MLYFEFSIHNIYLLDSTGQIISKRFFFLAEDSSKKRTKTRRMLVKTNSFIRFLKESLAWQIAFEINWLTSKNFKNDCLPRKKKLYKMTVYQARNDCILKIWIMQMIVCLTVNYAPAT